MIKAVLGLSTLAFKFTTAGKNVGLSRMHSNASDVVRVSLKHVYPLQGIVVEHTDLHVILIRETEKENIVVTVCLQN